jgi:hypothetical protein
VDQRAYEELVHKHWGLMMLVTAFSIHGRAFPSGQFPTLPIRVWPDEVRPVGLASEILDISGYADLAVILLERGITAIAEFQERYKIPPLSDFRRSL